MAISVTGGTTSPTSKKGKGKAKPKAFTIPLSFWEQHVVQATPPTWDEHATHLRDRQHDPPPADPQSQPPPSSRVFDG